MYYVLYLTVEEAREKKTVRNSSGRENAFTAFTENKPCVSGLAQFKPVSFKGCLLYTSDAADDWLVV